MVRIRVKAKPMGDMAAVTEIGRRGSQARTNLDDTTCYVGPEFSSDIFFPIGGLRELFEFGPNVGKFC